MTKKRGETDAVEKTEETAFSTSIKEKKVSVKTDAVRIYVGETVPGTVLTYGRLFRGELPLAVKGMIARLPDVEPLIIDINDLPQFTKKAAVKGTYENSLLKKAAEIVKERKF